MLTLIWYSHDHDHEHDDVSGSGPQDNLFQYIDRPNVVALNATGEGLKVIKPWHERLDEAVVRDDAYSLPSSHLTQTAHPHSP